MADFMQFLSENRPNGRQIVWMVRFFKNQI